MDIINVIHAPLVHTNPFPIWNIAVNRQLAHTFHHMGQLPGHRVKHVVIHIVEWLQNVQQVKRPIHLCVRVMQEHAEYIQTVRRVLQGKRI